MYVQSKNAAAHTVTLVSTLSELCSDSLEADDFNWIAFDCPPIGEPIRVTAKIRYNQREQPAAVTAISATAVRVVFDTPQKAVAKGQAVVLYDGDTVVGGGTIL
jgi:tRNA-specific 2-thiouridylase